MTSEQHFRCHLLNFWLYAAFSELNKAYTGSFLVCFHIFKQLFVLFESVSYRKRKGETQREMFHLLVPSSNIPSSQRCPRLKLRVRGCFWISHMGAGTKGHGPSSTAFPGLKHGAGLGSGTTKSRTSTVMGCCRQRISLLNHCGIYPLSK